MAQSVKKHLQCRRPGFDPWVRKIPWRREWPSTPVSLPENPHGQTSLADCSSWGHKESNKTELLRTAQGGSAGFPEGTSGKEPTASAGDVRDVDPIPGSGRSPGKGHGNPQQYFCLKNPMDRGAWQFIELQRVGHNQSNLACTQEGSDC